MAIQIQGSGGVVAEVDGTTFRALRVTSRPVDYGALGYYSACAISGTIAAGLASNADIFQMRWTDGTRFAVVYRLILDGLSGSSTAFTAGFASVRAFFSRAWSADGSGGTALTLTGNNQKLRTSMGTTLMGAIRASSTAALTAGTKTNDSQPIGQFTFTIGTTASVIYANQIVLLDEEDVGSQPAILSGTGGGEGLTVQATVPATGTWQFGITARWAEVTQY